ncbi:MlaD family protein [Dawidia soli]|uniref:MCE family protein n=1 Tax=Dawidia soli TaxID=2782352 RepID=A0AAP2GGL9_9BACT|nr:MlaD family protein [Dawidia soli]MBT1690742.1 MCE family protein [Dawidia soli]
MRNKTLDNTKVGLLVMVGLVFLVFTLYMIGRNRNLFGSTFTIHATLTHVNGLVPGNNVRFRGINVGTVGRIDVTSDTAIVVTLNIDESMKPYIQKNVVAAVGTDGLMGDKLINLNVPRTAAAPIEEHDTIQSLKPIETEEMLRTLNATNNNVERISTDLYEITTRLKSSESLWSLLSDSLLARNLRDAVSDFRTAGAHTADMTLTAKTIVRDLHHGDGIAYRLFADTSLSNKLDNSMQQIQRASQETSAMMKDLQQIVGNLRQGEGTAGLILADTLARRSLLRSLQSIEQGTGRFNENMEALRSNFLFRGYFNKQQRKQARREGKAGFSQPNP